MVIPPAGTSAYKAYQRQVQNQIPSPSGSSLKVEPFTSLSGKLFGALPDSPAKDYLVDKADKFETVAKPLKTTRRPTYTSGDDYGYVDPAPSAPALEYLNADLAKYYGMDSTTAYNEALSNTAYQRAVKDMQAAGLNPAVLFGHGRVSGADGVYGATPLSEASGVVSGSGSGFSRRSFRSSGKLFSSDAYGMISGAGALIGAVIGSKSGHVGFGAMTGSTIATSAAKVLNGLYQKFK